MKYRSGFAVSMGILSFLCQLACDSPSESPLFDGKTFAGWEGDTLNTWNIIDGALVGGSLEETVSHNDFLCTTASYGDFILKFKFKLEGNDGFINAGVQFRSRRATDPAYEMIGYQADIGNGYYGALYDETRRNRVLSGPDSITASEIVNQRDWNTYEIRAEKDHIQLFLNGQKTVDYRETDSGISRNGIIGLQIHGGGKALVSYKDMTIEELD